MKNSDDGSAYPVCPLFLNLKFGVTDLASATGFLVNSKIGIVLITARHNITGRNNITGQPLCDHGGVPDRVTISYSSATDKVKVVTHTESLFFADGSPRWVEHPTLGASADFVALPLEHLDNVLISVVDLKNPGDDLSLTPAESVSVVGFPFGLRSGGVHPIWATGFIASEFDIDYDDKPVFLIDCRSRKGQSGAPVIAKRVGFSAFRNGMRRLGQDSSRFLGIYSGRINDQSDLGLVWKVGAISSLVDSIK